MIDLVLIHKVKKVKAFIFIFIFLKWLFSTPVGYSLIYPTTWISR